LTLRKTLQSWARCPCHKKEKNGEVKTPPYKT
jgi:hypothetical protein